MDRPRMPVEFGFTTPSYLPPQRARPAWKTLVFGALLVLIPVVGPAVSAVYIDRRQVPGSYDFLGALRTAVIQVVAIALLAALVWVVLGIGLGVSLELNPRVNRPGV